MDYLSYINSQIELNELANMDEQIIALMKIKADNILLQKRLNKASKRLTQHYDFE